MIQVEFYKNSDKEKMNWKERPAVAQIRHVEENRCRTKVEKRGLERRQGTDYLKWQHLHGRYQKCETVVSNNVTLR